MKPLSNRYEYFESGHNINRKEIDSINTTVATMKNISYNRKNIDRNESIELLQELVNGRVKSELENSDFNSEFDKRMACWGREKSLLLRGDEWMNKIKEFLEKIKEYDEYVKSYVFEEYNKTNLWIILKNSTGDVADLIYDEILDTFDEDIVRTMIFDDKVSEEVVEEVRLINSNFEEHINE